ncbi:MAG: FAD-dependent oxidoreductase [Sphingobacteriia bacterium]
MIKLLRYYFSLLLLLTASSLFAQTIQTDVLIIGGGASGVSAGLQAGRLGVKTIIAEPTTWLGGMITSAGVSAFDGNHNMPSGIFGEFRNQLYQVYGGPSKVATGWVSMTQFEPHIGDSIFKKLVASVPTLQVLFNHQFMKVMKKNNTVIGALFRNKTNNRTITVYAKQVIDATELGDVFANAGVPYDLGMEASKISGENVGVEVSNDIIQDITYTAILKDYGKGKDCTIAKPAGYDPREFDGACTDYYIDKSRKAPNVDGKKMLDYGKLPNQKYMINWPGYGNDIYLNVVELDEASRQKELVKAKEQTLRFVYFIQNQLGFKNLGFADDEFPTKDRFPLIPYYREGRRVKGLVRFNIKHIANPFGGDMHLNRTGIAVGDYPIDHHHRKNPSAPQHLDFYPVPSFNIPLGSLIPAGFNGLIVAEKGISVSNIVNGTTRLQPSVVLIGQAAGTLAALSVKQSTNAASISVRTVQTSLLKSGAYIMPYFDVPLSHPDFLAAQRIGATDILKGKGVPHNWANQTFFYPDSLVNTNTLAKDLESVFKKPFIIKNEQLMMDDAMNIIAQLSAIISKEQAILLSKEKVTQLLGNDWKEGKALTRIQFAKLLDQTIHPFEKMEVDHKGFFKQTY